MRMGRTTFFLFFFLVVFLKAVLCYRFDPNKNELYLTSLDTIQFCSRVDASDNTQVSQFTRYGNETDQLTFSYSQEDSSLTRCSVSFSYNLGFSITLSEISKVQFSLSYNPSSNCSCRWNLKRGEGSQNLGSKVCETSLNLDLDPSIVTSPFVVSVSTADQTQCGSASFSSSPAAETIIVQVKAGFVPPTSVTIDTSVADQTTATATNQTVAVSPSVSGTTGVIESDSGSGDSGPSSVSKGLFIFFLLVIILLAIGVPLVMWIRKRRASAQATILISDAEDEVSISNFVIEEKEDEANKAEVPTPLEQEETQNVKVEEPSTDQSGTNV